MGEALITRRGGGGGGTLKSCADTGFNSTSVTAKIRHYVLASTYDSGSVGATSKGSSGEYNAKFGGYTISPDRDIDFAFVSFHGARGSYTHLYLNLVLVPDETVEFESTVSQMEIKYKFTLQKAADSWVIRCQYENAHTTTAYRLTGDCYNFTIKFKD